jgi:large subunit ribosomal protein L24
MNTLHVKKDQIVVVLSGAEKGKVGKILATLPGKGKVIVEGVRVIKKSARKSQDNPKGGIITKEAAFPASKVMLQEKFEARLKKRQGAAASA